MSYGHKGIMLKVENTKSRRNEEKNDSEVLRLGWMQQNTELLTCFLSYSLGQNAS
jgi:hypothetical protein